MSAKVQRARCGQVMDPAGKRESQEPETLHMQLSARMQEPDVIPNSSGSANASPTSQGCVKVRERGDRHDDSSGAGGGGGAGGSKPGDRPLPGTPPGAAGGSSAHNEAPTAALEADKAPATVPAAALAAAQPAAQPAAPLARPEQFTGGDSGLPLGFRGVWDEPYDEAAARDTLSTLYQHWCRPINKPWHKHKHNLNSNVNRDTLSTLYQHWCRPVKGRSE